MPMFFSRSLIVSPGVPLGRRNPWHCPSSEAYTRIQSDSAAKGTLHLVPDKIYFPFFFVAVVFRALGSKSKRGSMRAAEPWTYDSVQKCGNNSFFCFLRPAVQYGDRHQVWSRQRQGRGEVSPGKFFRSQHRCERGMLAETAVPFGNAGRQQSQFPAGLHPFGSGSLFSSASLIRVRNSFAASFLAASIMIFCSSVGSNEYILKTLNLATVFLT